ncbi:MAG: M56 family metallopeptidase [Planctomycetales bacterium]
MNLSFLTNLDVNSMLPTVLLWLVQITILAAFGLLTARWFSRDPASRHAILVVTLVATLAAPPITSAVQRSGWRLWSVAWEPAVAQHSVRESSSPSPEVAALPQPPVIADDEPFPEETSRAPALKSPLTTEPVATALPPQLRPSIYSFATITNLSRLLVLIWFAGAFLLFTRLCVGFWHVRRLVQKSEPLSLPETTLMQLQTLFSSFSPSCIRVHGSLPTAFATGLFRPVVILPRSYVQTLTEEELASVLTHELAHLTRRDPVVGLLQRVAAIVYWPHPLVHLLNRQLSRAREELCDNFALQAASTTQYAELLFRLAQAPSTRERIPAGLTISFLDSRWKLEHRIAGILDPRRLLTVASRRRLLASAVVFSLGLTVLLAGIQNADKLPGNVTPPDTSNFRVTLSDGTSIELLGVGEYPSNETPWWKPDGSPLTNKPKQPEPGLSWTEQRQNGPRLLLADPQPGTAIR